MINIYIPSIYCVYAHLCTPLFSGLVNVLHFSKMLWYFLVKDIEFIRQVVGMIGVLHGMAVGSLVQRSLERFKL